MPTLIAGLGLPGCRDRRLKYSAIMECISANGIVRTATAARCQYLPARSAAAAHSSDVATPTELSRALVGDAIEQVNLSIDGREEPQGVFLPRDGRSRIERRRHS